MKITLVSKGDSYENRELLKKCSRSKIEIQKLDILDIDSNAINDLGDVIIWGSNSLDSTSEIAFLNILKNKNKLIINSGLANFSSIIDSKSLQQKLVREFSVKLEFDSLDNSHKSSEKYEALILGGKMIVAVTRKSTKDGSSETVFVKDEKIQKRLSKIATKAAALFELQFCKVELIFNKKKDKFFFSSVDATPRWKDFQGNSKINIATEIIEYCGQLFDRKNKKTYELVRDYYDVAVKKGFLWEGKGFHYLSRMYLFSKDKRYLKEINSYKKEYITLDDASLKRLVTTNDNFGGRAGEIRIPYLKKYPKLRMYNKLLFKFCFCKSIYGLNIGEAISKYVVDEELLCLKKELEGDEKALATLSTLALNFIYGVEYYLRGKKGSNIDVKKMYEVARDGYVDDLSKYQNLRIYFLTHCIINESEFYQRKVKRNKRMYFKMMNLLESIIRDNYFDISLDNKFEFLVCARLCDYKTDLEKMIYSEADNSLSPLGNFIIDKHNSNALKEMILDLNSSEHRNVLYLMSKMEFKD